MGAEQPPRVGLQPDADTFLRALTELERLGVLLGSDPSFPSVASLVAGEPVRGSWWSHPRVHDIYAVSHSLGEHPDVLVVKLVSGKETYVHRRLWPALLAVASAREPWQLEGLPPMAARVLDLVSKDGELRTDSIPWTGGWRKDSPGEAARMLERRLLVHGEEVHTESGAHAKRLETWERWARRAGLAMDALIPAEGRRRLEDVVARINQEFRAAGRLPWQGTQR